MSEFTIKDGSEYVSYSTQQEVTNYSYTGSYTVQVNEYVLSDGRIQKLVKDLTTYNRKFKHIQAYSRPI